LSKVDKSLRVPVVANHIGSTGSINTDLAMIGAQLGDANRVTTYAGQALSAAWHTKVRSTAGATECGDRSGHTPILSYGAASA
jgi:hypothetical protein